MAEASSATSSPQSPPAQPEQDAARTADISAPQVSDASDDLSSMDSTQQHSAFSRNGEGGLSAIRRSVRKGAKKVKQALQSATTVFDSKDRAESPQPENAGSVSGEMDGQLVERKKIQPPEKSAKKMLDSLWETYRIAHKQSKHAEKLPGRIREKVINTFCNPRLSDRDNHKECIQLIQNIFESAQSEKKAHTTPSIQIRLFATRETLNRTMKRLNNDELDHAILAASDCDTFNVLENQAEKKISRSELILVLKQIESAAKGEQCARYQTTPLNILIDCGKSILDAEESNTHLIPDECMKLVDDIQKAMRLLHYGLETLRAPGQTRRDYFADLIKSCTKEEQQLLSRAVATNKDEDAQKLIKASLPDSNGPRTAYHRRVFIEFRATLLVKESSSDRSVALRNEKIFENAEASPPDWPDKAVGAAKPHHRSSWIRRAGGFLWQYATYLVGSGDFRAEARIRYLKKHIDLQVDALLKTLARTPEYEHAQAAINLRVDRLLEAADAFEVELQKQQSTKTAEAYLQNVLERKFGGLNGKSMKRIFDQMKSMPKEPTSVHAPTNPFQIFARDMGMHWRNRFHDAGFTKTLELEKGRRTRNERAGDIWNNIKHLLPLESTTRGFSIPLGELSRLLKSQHPDHHKICECLSNLAMTDAQENGIEREIRPEAFKIALNRLEKDELNGLMRRLKKHSITSGRDMNDFFKPQKQETTKPIHEDDQRMYRTLLEGLYIAGQKLDWDQSTEDSMDSDSDSPGLTKSSSESSFQALEHPIPFKRASRKLGGDIGKSVGRYALQGT